MAPVTPEKPLSKSSPTASKNSASPNTRTSADRSKTTPTPPPTGKTLPSSTDPRKRQDSVSSSSPPTPPSRSSKASSPGSKLATGLSNVELSPKSKSSDTSSSSTTDDRFPKSRLSSVIYHDREFLGAIICDVNRGPKLQVVSVLIEIPKKYEHNRKLHRAIFTELFKSELFRLFESDGAINFKTGMPKTVDAKPTTGKATIYGELVMTEEKAKFQKPIKSIPIKGFIKGKGDAVENAICTVEKVQTYTLDDHGEEYLKRLEVLLRNSPKSTSSGIHSSKGQFSYPKPPPGFKKRSVAALKIHPRVEYVPSIQKVDNKAQLRFDFRVGAYYDSCPVTEMLFSYFGETVMCKGLCQNTPTLRRLESLLVGLPVRRSYVPLSIKDRGPHKRDASNNVESRVLKDSEVMDEGFHIEARRSRIKAVKMPADIYPFEFTEKAEGTTKMTVTRYFEGYIRPGAGNGLKFPNLPLANIGGTKEGREAWVPLEFLWIEPNQKVPVKLCILQGDSKAFKKSIPPEKPTGGNDGDRFLSKIADAWLCGPWLDGGTKDTVDNKHKIRWSNRKFEEPPENQLLELESPPKTDAKPRVETHGKGRLERFGLLNLVSLQDPDIEALEDRFRLAIPALSKMVLGSVNNPPKYWPGRVNDTTELLSDPDKFAKHFDSKTQGALLCLMDPVGKDAKEVANATADFHRFGDLVAGVPTVHASKAVLEALPEWKDQDYFPANIARKLKFMLGGTNYQTDLAAKLKDMKVDGEVMVVGAHIAHPGAGPTEMLQTIDGPPKIAYPSIAAVVASVDDKLVHFPGSMRLQRTFDAGIKESKDSNQKPKVIRTTRVRIDDLKKMMVERVQAWSKRNGKKSPKNILFFRDGLTREMGDLMTQVVDQECMAIKDAFQSLNLQSPAITYVVFTKKLKLLTHPESSPAGQVPFEYTRLVASTDAKTVSRKNYLYTVLKDDMKLGKANMEVLTEALNTSSQLARQVACALPVHYATKLTARGFEYIRTLSVNDYSRHPDFVPLLAGDNYNEKADKVLEYVRQAKWLWGCDGERGNPWKEQLDELMFYL
ncbi:hypothetical protein BU16DRAFT_576323 [Lophium mytilinum]|uniref:Piwi domain-containing protein n=1 Tax=Lophium mytilinum TaxID=390894 RepID=A0A6A6RCL5_9PEZI|nr:hypothetical protein BU16DRAFT_576323 [Lophium mytilinum]